LGGGEGRSITVNFASWSFILLFLPVVTLIFVRLSPASGAPRRQLFLIGASLAFYSYSGWQNALVLTASVLFNLTAARVLMSPKLDVRSYRRAVMWLAVGANLAALGAFKLNILVVEGPKGFSTAESILLPLALSYVTFQQVSFVVSCYKRQMSQFITLDYLFFIFFFPQLIMGPIVRFRDISSQLRDGALSRVSSCDMAIGFSIFVFGFAKKVLLADQIAPSINRLFLAGELGGGSTVDLWFAAIGFYLQLFLDFSAYAEMAIGLGRMFGIRLPVNFDRPLFASDRFDYWRRWHITFVIFMRTHVFFPLVRHAGLSVPVAMFITGFLSGIWHGLGWTFVLWGFLQTVIMLISHQRRKRWRQVGPMAGWVRIRKIVLTLVLSVLLATLFRSSSLEGALNVYQGLFAWHGLDVSSGLSLIRELGIFGLCAAFIWLVPDAKQIFRQHWNALDLRPDPPPMPVHWSERYLSFEPNRVWGMVTALLLFVSLLNLGGPERFIYVQF